MISSPRITFVGAARQVTGSCFFVEAAGARFLIDCGMFQGRDAPRLNRADWPFDPRSLDFVLLTHAHVDHCGLLPRLWAFGFRGAIHTTPATRDVAAVMLADSAHIQETDWMRHERKHGGRRVKRDDYPLYTVAQAEACMRLFRTTPYDQEFSPHAGLRCRFRDAGHILGSSIIELWTDTPQGERKLVFSGDLGQPGRPIVRDPTPIEDADVLVVESTYGDREHRSLAETVEELAAAIRETLVERHGNLIVPAFALGRTQELLYLLLELRRRNQVPHLRVFVDSPLAFKATQATLQHPECLDEETLALLADSDKVSRLLSLKFTESVEDSMALNRLTGGALIIAASGMCDAGRIRHHLRHNLPRAENAVLIVGFQAEGTLGRRLVDHAARVRIFGEEVPVRARIHTLGGLSAHADRTALLGWLRKFRAPPASTFVVHGEARTAEGFAATLSGELGWPRVEAPAQGETRELQSAGVQAGVLSGDGHAR